MCTLIWCKKNPSKLPTVENKQTKKNPLTHGTWFFNPEYAD